MSERHADRLDAALGGKYRIERKLGEGGMASVYLAEDLKHERKVALKILRPELAAVIGAERFLSEIKTTANLQHPHILPLFDSGEADSLLFYVMPFVKGESLRERLDRERQLPIDEAVRIAIAVASALEHAHKAGIVHRDIKPANILVHDGEPLISDFGIALALGVGAESRLTETGLSLGTPHYMSLEQATGDSNVGPATDVYALGCVLYEMLAGEPPFTGSTPQAILGKIALGNVVPVTEQRPSVPAHVAGALAKALERVPADRFQSGGDFARALGDRSFRWATGAEAIGASTWKIAIGAAGTAAAITAALFVAGAALRSNPSETSALQAALTYTLPDGQLLARGNPSTLEISPDGARFAYIAQEGGERRIYVRELASFEARALAGTEGASSLFFSPDGKSVGFHSDGALRRVSVEGGIPARIVDVPEIPTGVSWGDDGTIVYGQRGSRIIFRVSAGGGAPTEVALGDSTALANVPEGRLDVRWPRHLPVDNLALVSTGSGLSSSFGVVDLRDGRFRPLMAGDRAHYLPSGHIVFYSNPETVNVVPFDLERLEITGPVVPIAGDVLRPAGSQGRFSVARDGTMVYARGGFERQLILVDRNGRESPVDVGRRGYRMPDVSPDGRFVAVTVDPTPSEMWVVDLTLSRAQPVSTGGYHLQPAWSPDGSRLAISTNPGVAWIPWPGGGDPIPLNPSGYVIDWPVSDRMFGDGRNRLGGNGLAVLDVASGTWTDWLIMPDFPADAAGSPDGAWVAYASPVSGVPEVYVRAIGGAPPATLVSRGGGGEPRWSADGSEIYYRSGNTIMAVPVRTGTRFEVTGPPTALFSGDYDFSNDRNWDVLPDGRFFMIRSSPGVGREIRVMMNWVEHVDFGAEQSRR